MPRTKRVVTQRGFRVLTRAEYRALLEERMQEYLQMSVASFTVARRNRKLRKGPLTAHLEALMGERTR